MECSNPNCGCHTYGAPTDPPAPEPLAGHLVPSDPEPEKCGWLVEDGVYDDGSPRIVECERTDLNEHDGLCGAHTRGMSLEDYYAPFGPAWQEEQR